MYKRNNIILISLQGRHRTVVNELAAKINFNILELEKEIEKLYRESSGKKATFSQIIETHGKDYFCQLERKVLFKIKNIDRNILSLPYYTLLSPDNKLVLKSLGQVVFMFEKNYERFVKTKEFEVLKNLVDESRLGEREYNEMIQLFRNMSDLTIDIKDKDKADAANEVLDYYKDILFLN